MANLVLISGANSSGKSLYAEQLIAQMTGPRYYVATMHPCTDENHRRIEKHRAQRCGLGFQTLEYPYQVGSAPVTADSVVLLEDVSNLLANAIFEKGGDAAGVFQDICALRDRCRVLVAVTIAGLQDEGYDAMTAAYINGLNQINRELLDCADVAVTLQNRLPVYQKGDIHDLF